MVAATRRAPRRSLNRLSLRVQGRLDSDRADRVLPWAFAGLLTLALGLLHTAQNRSLAFGSGLAPWLQAVWRRDHGGVGTPMGGVDPARGSPVSELVLWIARQVPAETLFVGAQAAAIGLAIVPLWHLARKEAHLRVGATTAVIVAFALAPALHRATLSSFHPELLALPALIGTYRRILNQQWWHVGIYLGFTMLCRADLGFTVAAIGLFMLSTGRRRPGLVATVAGTLWSVGAYLLLRPDYPAGRLTPAGEFVTRSTGPLAAFPDLVGDPWHSITTMLSEPSVRFLVLILAPLIFLPLMAPRRLVIALPGLSLALLTDIEVQRRAERGVLDLAPLAAHVGAVMAFVFIALVFALERIAVPSVTRVNVDRRVLLSLLAGATLLFVIESPVSPYQHPWSWGSRDAADGARLAVADSLDPDASLAVSPSMSALVAERRTVVELPPDPGAITEGRLIGLRNEVAFIVLDTTPSKGAPGPPSWDPDNTDMAFENLEVAGFIEVYAVGDVHVFARR